MWSSCVFIARRAIFIELSLFRNGCGWLCCLRKVPDELVKLKAHMAIMHDMQTLKVVMPSESDLAKKYALSK